MRTKDKTLELPRHGGNIYRFEHAVLDFSANLNPLGMPEAVKQAAMDAVAKSEAYPDPHCKKLRQALSKHCLIPANQIVCGNGAADLIDRVALAFRPKRTLLFAPTFSEYERALQTLGSEVVYYELKAERSFVPEEDLEARIAGCDLVFLCNPNNPTGTVLKKDRMKQVAECCLQTNTRLVVDECFMDFLEREEDYSLREELSSFPNLILLKAFTKLYAMAGLRLGYVLCGREEDATCLADTLQPWAVSTVASAAGIAALQEDEFVRQTKQYVAKQRLFLQCGLKQLGFTVYPSLTNYLLFQSDIELLQPLEQQGILLRSCGNYRTLDHTYYRTAVRSQEENQRLLNALQHIVEEFYGKGNYGTGDLF